MKARSTWVSKDRCEHAPISIGQFRNVYLAPTSFRRSSSTSLPFLSIRADQFDRTLRASQLLGTEAEGYKAACKRTQHCWMLHVASVSTPCCMLLDVVACCCAKFETSQTFQPTTPNISFVLWSPKRSATMLDPFVQLFQHCCGHARSLRMVYKDLWVRSFPRCTVGPNNAESCCIRLHTTANTDATTPNIVAPLSHAP